MATASREASGGFLKGDLVEFEGKHYRVVKVHKAPTARRTGDR